MNSNQQTEGMRNRYIYKYVAAAVCIFAAAMPSWAQDVCGMGIEQAFMKRNAGLMTVDMSMDLGSFDLGGNRVAVFAPAIVNGTDTLVLQPVGLYSRTRWYQYLRAGEQPVGGEGETSIRWTERPATMDYSQTIPYEPWMNGSQLYLVRSDYGCCRTLVDYQIEPILTGKDRYPTAYRDIIYEPQFRYVRPVAEDVKTRELVGKAYIDFPVNRTELYPDYRKNPVELAKIIATIDSVRNDKDVTVRRITIKGYASPESPYDNNTRLAKGRTATLKQYVRNLYSFSDDFIATDYEPEDWAGLRAFVETSGLEHKKEILALIDDSTIEPDPKEALIKSRYPEEYRFLLQTVYPGLRHSDYTIEYTIRQFTDIDEIRSILATAPQKLSLNEMFLLAQTYEPGSDAYNEVFETAVRMYPNDEVANLNAANAAMNRNDYATAAKYLEKVGDKDEAVYARGVLCALKGDYANAVRFFSLVEGKVPEAREALEMSKRLLEQSEKK